MAQQPGVAARLGRPPSSNSAETRRRLLDAARTAFADRGYDTTTNRSLSAEVGITSGAIYHYFGSKLDLYIAVHADVQEQVYSRFQVAVAGASTFRGQLRAVLDVAHELNEADPSLAQFLGAVRVDMRRHAELQDALHLQASRRERFFDRLVDVGVQTGEIEPSQRAMGEAFVATILIGLTDAVSGDQQRHRDAVDAIKALVENRLIRQVPDPDPSPSGTR